MSTYKIWLNRPMLERGAAGWRIDAGEHRLQAAIVVDAAGAWADDVAAMAGLPGCGIRPFARTVATFDLSGGIDAARW